MSGGPEVSGGAAALRSGSRVGKRRRFPRGSAAPVPRGGERGAAGGSELASVPAVDPARRKVVRFPVELGGCCCARKGAAGLPQSCLRGRCCSGAAGDAGTGTGMGLGRGFWGLRGHTATGETWPIGVWPGFARTNSAVMGGLRSGGSVLEGGGQWAGSPVAVDAYSCDGTEPGVVRKARGWEFRATICDFGMLLGSKMAEEPPGGAAAQCLCARVGWSAPAASRALGAPSWGCCTSLLQAGRPTHTELSCLQGASSAAVTGGKKHLHCWVTFRRLWVQEHDCTGQWQTLAPGRHRSELWEGLKIQGRREVGSPGAMQGMGIGASLLL